MKNARHSLALLRRTRELVLRAGVPVAVGASRKSFLTVVDGGAAAKSAPSERVGASIAAALHAAQAGAAVLRVHDVRATAQAIDLDATLAGRGP
jgi:dihydropteroate synthase